MTDRRDLDAKLATVDQWVADQLTWVGALAAEHGCEEATESGPGRSFRLGRSAVLRAHPKQSHLALGFPNAMREDVAALTAQLRDQRRTAWVNWAPEVLTRETVADLLDRAVHHAAGSSSDELDDAASAASDHPAHPAPDVAVAGERAASLAPPARPASQAADATSPPPPGSSAADATDLGLLLALVGAFAEHERATGRPVSTRVLREATYFHWERPRLPRGGKYSPLLPHTAAARAHRRAGQINGLVFEHAYPVNLLLRELLAEPPETAEQLRACLHARAERVIVTREENDALTAAGLANRVPDPQDVWSRYRAVGIDPAQVAPYADDVG